MNTVNKPFRKKDAMQLVTGQPVYMDDVIPQDCLIVKLLRSPHANAMVRTINTTVAKKVPGIEAIFTWEDVPQDAPRYTQAGQTFPEASPRDRLVIDRHVRFVGDVVAIVAGKDEKCVDKALKLIKVDYEVLESVLDFHTAKDNPVLVHPEDNWEALSPVGADNKRNLCAHDECGSGDIDAVLAGCDVVIDHVYHTKACQQAMMETFRTYCSIDTYGRLNVLSSTQIVFHARRNIANALHIPKSMVRVAKPRVGGGFGAKQTAVSEVYPAFVTWKTKKPSKIIFSRVESQTASSPRHEMEMHVRLGATKDGIVKGIDLYTLSNTGAYGEHGPTTVGLSGHKSIPLYGKAEAFRFVSDVVYTNHMSAGAYRGYGATQGLFAVESAVNELAHKLNMDPFALRLKNTVQEGDVMPAYYGAVNTSCALDRCLVKVREMIDWEHKYPAHDLGNGKVRAVGMGMAMQGSGISGMDVGSATLKLNDDGFYSLIIGAADMGTGCDTTLAQIAAEVLDCPLDNIAVFGADTDTSPYDSGSYASSTTYVTGKATEKCAMKLREQICKLGAELLGCPADAVEFDGKEVFESAAPETKKTLSEIAYASQFGPMVPLERQPVVLENLLLFGFALGLPFGGREAHFGRAGRIDALGAALLERRDELRDGSRLLLRTVVPMGEHFEERPLRPLVVAGVARAHLAVPVERETDLVQLFAVAGDVLLGRHGRVLARLDGVLLGGQAEGVVSHRVQDVEALEPLVARVDVRGDVAQRVPDVQARSRRIGEHVQHIEFGPRGVRFHLVGLVRPPAALPFGLDLLEIVLHISSKDFVLSLFDRFWFCLFLNPALGRACKNNKSFPICHSSGRGMAHKKGHGPERPCPFPFPMRRVSRRAVRRTSSRPRRVPCRR